MIYWLDDQKHYETSVYSKTKYVICDKMSRETTGYILPTVLINTIEISQQVETE